MSSGQTYGTNLPDQVDLLANLSDAQFELLADVRDLHRDRAALEREYASKLQVLARKAADKKSKKIAALVVGNEPTKAWGEDTIQRSTLEIAYSQIISAMLDAAQDHINLADSLNSQVVETLKATERRHEEAKRKQMQFFQKLLSERDRAYAERVKSKQKYDDECTEVETYRQKQERSADDRHADRAAKQYEQQQVDMLNGKNVYIISTAIANQVKAKFYNEDLPALEDQFQALQTQLLTKFVNIMLQAQALHTSHLDALRTHVSVNEQKLRAISPAADQDLFIECNIRPFTLPPDWGFEPCATHYDTGEMSVEPAPKVYLQNRLARCRGKLYELHPVMDAKRKEVEQFSKLADAYSADRNLGDVEEVSDNYLESQHQLTFYATSERILSTEAETITASLGGDEGGQRPHTFKSSAFSIPTTCAYCKSNIWGLSKQGKTCKSCGISVHSRCELKVPAECGVSRGSGRETATLGPVSSISRSSSTISKAPSRAPPTSALTKPTPSSFAHGVYTTEEAFSQARVVFSFTSTSPFELAVSEGAIVQVLEEDDGSGWVKVADNSGGRGLVPASYIELLSAVSTTPQNPVAIPASSRQQGSGQYVKGVFQYEAQGPDELSVNEGQLIELTGGLSGGSNYADGWWEGIDTSGKRGIFPSNYVKLVR